MIKKLKYLILFFCLLIGFIISSCDKEKIIMRKQSGAWEIKKLQTVTYSNGTVLKDTTINDAGYVTLWNNNVNGVNDAHYNFTTSPLCWQIIANNYTGLDLKEDNCWWQSDTYDNDRIAFSTLGRYDEIIMMMLTIKKINKNKQEWIFVNSGNDSLSTMSYKEVLTMERARD